jgi:deoxyribonuclease IV
LANAAHRAHQIGCDAFQMFSANPRGWRAVEVPEAAFEAFREARDGFALAPAAVHANYLINLASAEPAIRALSVAALRSEFERAAALGADYLVLHPGCAKDGGRARACRTVVESLGRASRGMKLNGLTLLLENTAGQGTSLGADLDELAEIMAGAAQVMRAGVCLDTAHLLAAGYPVHTPRGLAETIRRIDASVGLGNVRLIHANDSKTALGSHVDRHEHIGRGHIGRDGFRRIVRHPKLRRIPFICETPIDRPGDDRRNVRMMRSLAEISVAGKAAGLSDGS